jgi:P-type E1-E2 ATPase
LPENINLFVVLVVVAIPEGLPLVTQVSLAFSVMRMFKQDRILLRKQDALERIAEANEFLIGKGNILTTGKMRVKQFHLEGSTKQNARPDTFLNCELAELTIKLIQEGILYNNSAYV